MSLGHPPQGSEHTLLRVVRLLERTNKAIQCFGTLADFVSKNYRIPQTDFTDEFYALLESEPTIPSKHLIDYSKVRSYFVKRKAKKSARKSKNKNEEQPKENPKENPDEDKPDEETSDHVPSKKRSKVSM